MGGSAVLRPALVPQVALVACAATGLLGIDPGDDHDDDSDRAHSGVDTSLMVRALGSLSVTRGGQDIAIAKAKVRAVLAVLLIHRESIVPAEVMIDHVWGPRPSDSARHALHVAISSLRGVFGCAPRDDRCNLISSPAGYRLELETDEFDVAIAESLVRLARRESERGHVRAAEATYLAAESWFHSPPYAEFSYEEFAQPEIRRLTELYWGAREERLGIQLELAEHRDIIPELEALVIEHPSRERLLRYLMAAMCRSGRTGDALEAYESVREVLDREYRCPPSRETVALAEHIRGSGTAAQ